MDKLYFNADGTIQKVIQTRGGGTGGDNKALTATAGHDPRLNVSPAQAPPAAVTPAAPAPPGSRFTPLRRVADTEAPVRIFPDGRLLAVLSR
ncbi:hypothetical protein [Microbispora rosea]|uniref:hypothetical protein n=1 Tax=Microbispora rosea TaxID=58117 RepID=UPI00378DA239